MMRLRSLVSDINITYNLDASLSLNNTLRGDTDNDPKSPMSWKGRLAGTMEQTRHSGGSH